MTAMLELTLVEEGPASSKEALLQARNGAVPSSMSVVPGASDSGRTGDRSETVYYLVRRTPVVTGRDLRNAKPSLDEMNRPAVSFTLNNDGARKFAEITQRNKGLPLGIFFFFTVGTTCPPSFSKIFARYSALPGSGSSVAISAARHAASV